MLRATKIRIYPNKAQEQRLAQDFGNARKVWNMALEMKEMSRGGDKKPLTCYDIKKMLPIWKKGDYPYLSQTYASCLQESILHLDRAYKDAFERQRLGKTVTKKNSKNTNRYGFPVFKSKHDSRHAISYPQHVKVLENKISVPKIGKIKAKVHRQIVGKIRTVTISRESTGKYYASILTDDAIAPKLPLKQIDASRVVGLDLGVIDWIVDSNGKKLANPKFLKKRVKKLARLNRSLSRKIEAAKKRCVDDGKPLKHLHNYCGSNILKDRKRLALEHEKVRHARNNFQHQVSRTLANDNQVVVAETLNVMGLLSNRKLSKAISDCAWGGFLNKLDYKLKNRGGQLVRISTWFPSTKMCNHCGTINDEISLRHRVWTCQGCHAVVDRDINAAINIREAGILQLKAAGLSVYAHGGHVSLDEVYQAKTREVGSLVFN